MGIFAARADARAEPSDNETCIEAEVRLALVDASAAGEHRCHDNTAATIQCY
jgi:hypothetical protein